MLKIKNILFSQPIEEFYKRRTSELKSKFVFILLKGVFIC